MLTTVKAVVKNDRIHWEEAVEKVIPRDQAVEVLVTILRSEASADVAALRGQRRLEAIRQLSRLGGIACIDDPVAWQREMRSDRDLPGRES